MLNEPRGKNSPNPNPSPNPSPNSNPNPSPNPRPSSGNTLRPATGSEFELKTLSLDELRKKRESALASAAKFEKSSLDAFRESEKHKAEPTTFGFWEAIGKEAKKAAEAFRKEATAVGLEIQQREREAAAKAAAEKAAAEKAAAEKPAEKAVTEKRSGDSYHQCVNLYITFDGEEPPKVTTTK